MSNHFLLKHQLFYAQILLTVAYTFEIVSQYYQGTLILARS